MLTDAIVEMTEKGLGMTTIATDDRQLLGIFTDGDLRRAVENGTDMRATPLTDAMTADARTIHEELAAEAMALMENIKSAPWWSLMTRTRFSASSPY